MFTDVFNEFIDKNVEVTTNFGKSYSGTLRRSSQQEAIIISSHEGYYAKRYGPIFIKESEIVSVREIIPHIDEDEKDCEDNQMLSPYKKYSPLNSHDAGVDEGDEVLDNLFVDEDV